MLGAENTIPKQILLGKITSHALPDWIKGCGTILAVAAAYYIAGRIGLLFASRPGFATAVWPASGIALAAVLRIGYGIVPGIFLGSFLINLSSSLETAGTEAIAKSMAVVISIGIGASLQAMAGAFLIRRFITYPTAFVEMKDIAKFLFLGGPISCLINATWSATILWLSGLIQSVDFLFHWWTWWVGDAIGVITFTPLLLIWGSKPELVSRRRQIAISLPLGLAFIMIALFFAFTNAWEQDRMKLGFERQTDRVARQLKENFEDYIEVLHSIEGLFASSPSVSRQQFKIFVTPLFSRHQGIRGLAWNPRVLDSERTKYEQAAIKDGISRFEIKERNRQSGGVRAARRPEYVPIYYVISEGGNEKPLGLDGAFDPARKAALDRARDTGQPIATAPLTLDAAGDAGLVVFLPVYTSGLPHDTPEQRRMNLQGYISGAFRMRDIINNAVKKAEIRDIEVELYDAGSEARPPLDEFHGQQQQLHSGHGENNPAGLGRVLSVQTAGRQWTLQFAPTKKYFLAQRRWQVWGVLAAGLFFTGLLGAFLLAVTGHDAKLQAINTELNKEIADRTIAEREVSKMAALVRSSYDSIVGTTLEGMITSWNKGAEMLYGYSADEVRGRPISILYPPGRLDEMSWLLETVKQGKPVAQYETVRVTKNKTQLDVSLTLSAIKDATGQITGVASVTRDISERKRADAELERHREDVAHRLHDSVIQSLTAISLHLELARREVVENPKAATQRLGKIDRVVGDEQQNLRSFVRELKGIGLAGASSEFSGTAGLEELIDRLENQWGVSLSLQLEKNLTSIPKNIATDLAYIIQEGVANAVRHGHASKVNVIVGREGADLTISILDNGKGFPFHGYYDSAALDANKSGPVMLRSRIASLKGTLSIRSADTGASLEIRVPFWQEGTSNGNQTRNRR